MALRLHLLALDLLYPERCVSCGAFGDSLCGPCEATMVACTAGARCPNCSARWEGGGNCPRCFAWDALAGAVAAFDMEGTARKVIHGFKYRGIRALGGRMAGHLAGLREGRPFDVAFAVPLHRSRLRRRGFNQSGVLLDLAGWPCGPGRLERVRRTATQVGMRLHERRNNVRGAFRYRGPTLTGLKVALVDDVVTTGATANECARVLRDFGAAQVHAIAFARANYDPAAAEGPIED